MEIANRRLKGLCFHCDNEFTQGHKKECKQLFFIEILCDNYETAPNLIDEPLISLSALIDIHPTSTQTMQVYVDVGDATLTALLDSGSTHNFIDSVMAACLGIPL